MGGGVAKRPAAAKKEQAGEPTDASPAANLGPPEDQPQALTVIGFGSLLSEKSARSTFPEATAFRLARVRGFRRVFRHPAGVFFERGIVPDTPGKLECSSLS